MIKKLLQTTFLVASLPCASFFFVSSAYAKGNHQHVGHNQSQNQNHVQLYAPAGVMGDHLHEVGSWMTSYNVSHMGMSGMRYGSSDVNQEELRERFMVAPTKMNMTMQMFGIMYGITESTTVMAMVPHVQKNMSHVTRMGQGFSTKTSGVGDAKVTILHDIGRFFGMGHATHSQEEQRNNHQQLLVNIGISLPTGSVNERGGTPMSADMLLAYPMQLGSGTYDPIMRISYSAAQEKWRYGAQAGAVIRTGNNNQGYRLGNQYDVTAWVGREVLSGLTLSTRLQGRIGGNISGGVAGLNLMMAPSANSDMHGSKAVDAFIGLQYAPKILDGKQPLELSVEAGAPLYQHVDGYQMERDYQLLARLRWSF